MGATVKATYVGEGEYLDQIPARDLTEEEFDALTIEQKYAVAKSGLYELEGGELPPLEDAAPVDEAPTEEPAAPVEGEAG